MLPALVAVTLLAAPEARAIVYTYPLGALASVGVTAASDVKVGWIPLGVEVPLRADLAIGVEATVAVIDHGRGLPGGWSLTASAGPTWFPFTGDRALGGFFIGPRLQVMVGEAARIQVIRAASGSGPLDAGPALRRSFLVGFDLGWQFRVGRVVFGPVLGASAGFTFDSTSVFANPLERAELPSGNRPDTFAFGLNLNLFKLGVAL